MRRSEREIADRAEIEEILREARVCRIGLSDNDRPYIVPVCFGYRDGALYFHSAPEGRKIGILRKNPAVCFELDEVGPLVMEGASCSWGMRYRSVIGTGTAVFLEDESGKKDALRTIVLHYGPVDVRIPCDTGNVAVIRVDIEEMTGKKSG